MECVRCPRPAVALLRFTPQYLEWVDRHECNEPNCMFRDVDVTAMRDDRMPVCAPHRDWTLAKAAAESPDLGCAVFDWDEIGPDDQPRRPRSTCRYCDAPIERLAAGYWVDGRGFVGCAPLAELPALVHWPKGAPA